MTRRSRITVLIGVEGKADAKFVKSFLIPELHTYGTIHPKIYPANGDGQRILQRIDPQVCDYDHAFIFADGDRWGPQQDAYASRLGIKEHCIITFPCLEALILELTHKLPRKKIANTGEAKTHFRRCFGGELHKVSFKKFNISPDDLRNCKTLKPWWDFVDNELPK